jgi:hypothetical protein
VKDVEHLQQQLERRHDKKWKKLKKTSQKVKLAKDFEVQKGKEVWFGSQKGEAVAGNARRK